MQALQMRFVSVALFSSDDECLMGLSVVKSHGSLNLSTLRWLLAKSDAWSVLQETKYVCVCGGGGDLCMCVFRDRRC